MYQTHREIFSSLKDGSHASTLFSQKRKNIWHRWCSFFIPKLVKHPQPYSVTILILHHITAVNICNRHQVQMFGVSVKSCFGFNWERLLNNTKNWIHKTYMKLKNNSKSVFYRFGDVQCGVLRWFCMRLIGKQFPDIHDKEHQQWWILLLSSVILSVECYELVKCTPFTSHNPTHKKNHRYLVRTELKPWLPSTPPNPVQSKFFFAKSSFLLRRSYGNFVY